eukprot:CAMPEP_0171991296 /NCGR_PEP_ID=MMETSP0993-20121228/277358_1 /TAXON_ID=483369 /ORGANISM="non described non described, Strain CCMP2098" /LENGTH=252 /DNA_ID=CAMNT_0012644319 /DNA_START=1 /DNA_END=759 /DNA_ORIENTATION=-
MSEEEERRYRRKTVIFMENLSEKVRIDWQSQATAQIFFHYFFARHSFRRHQRFNVAVACLFLAAKVEECDSPHARHLESLVKHSHELWHRLQPNYVPLSGGSAEYQTLSQDILACERKILHTIAFDFIVEKPHNYFINKMKTLVEGGGSSGSAVPLVPEALRREFGRQAAKFLRMSLRTSLCLQFSPPAIASAVVALAAVYLDLPLPAAVTSGGSSQGIRPPSRQVLENEPPNQPLPAGEKENKQTIGGVVG